MGTEKTHEQKDGSKDKIVSVSSEEDDDYNDLTFSAISLLDSFNKTFTKDTDGDGSDSFIKSELSQHDNSEIEESRQIEHSTENISIIEDTTLNTSFPEISDYDSDETIDEKL